jgi:cation diffusion facilitator CzcD-associated flavoprotein CzcO
MPQEHLDVLIVGAGISGVGAGYHLQKNCPNKTYAILEARHRGGGTWDLFRYPGVRSDSDMFTLGYSFRPWRGAKAIADGPSILEYLEETAREYGIDRHIRFDHKVKSASWSARDAQWSVEVEQGPSCETVRFTCNFLFMCAGYYNYAQGYTPEFPGVARFAGRIVHPQKWTQDIDYSGKRVVVIGSGATAVTLVPELAKSAAHVVMLQRSPTYVVSWPASDSIADWLRRCLPAKIAYGITRWKNVLRGMLFFKLARSRPERMKQRIRDGVLQALGSGYDVDKHFKPRYNPWDQRMCLVPDGDLFEALKAGRASVVTDGIETFTEQGIKLKSGEELAADLIVTATGLNMQMLGGAQLSIDGRAVDVAAGLVYKGLMCSDIPNFAWSFGYTNASWTLKCDLTCEYVCRLLSHMDAHGYRYCTPRNTDVSMGSEPWIDFSSGYVQRALSLLPKQGKRKPWRLNQNYALDLIELRYGALDDGVLEFSGRG